MNEIRTEKYLLAMEQEYINFMNSYFKLMSYNSKIKKNNEISDEQIEKINLLREKIEKKIKQIYDNLHINGGMY